MLGSFQKRQEEEEEKEPKNKKNTTICTSSPLGKKREEAAATLAITSYQHCGKQLVRDRRNAEATVCETRAAGEE